MNILTALKARSFVDEKGHHGYNCTQSKGGASRHGELSQIVQRALTSIKIASSLTSWPQSQ